MTSSTMSGQWSSRSSRRSAVTSPPYPTKAHLLHSSALLLGHRGERARLGRSFQGGRAAQQVPSGLQTTDEVAGVGRPPPRAGGGDVRRALLGHRPHPTGNRLTNPKYDRSMTGVSAAHTSSAGPYAATVSGLMALAIWLSIVRCRASPSPRTIGETALRPPSCRAPRRVLIWTLPMPASIARALMPSPGLAAAIVAAPPETRLKPPPVLSPI